MGKTFFVDWALWEKMTFVLACAIVLTICAGGLKLWYTTRRNKKYSAIQSIQAKRASIRSKLSRRGTLKSRFGSMREKRVGSEVPFGIRAIESGIEVEGVWISRSNTPASTRENSVVTFTQFKNALPRHNSMIDLSKLEAQIESCSEDITDSRPASMERYSKETSAASDLTAPSGSPTPETTANLINPMQHERATSSGHGSEFSRNGSSGSNEFSSAPAAVVSPQPCTPNHASLDLLEEHRMSHIAETGQLLPRTRRPGHSGEWASIASQPVTPPPAPYGQQHTDYFSHGSTSPTTPSTADPNYANSFATSQASQIPPTLRPDPAIVPATQPINWSLQESNQIPDRETPPEEGLRRPSFSHDTHVLRHVNSGFVILKPGTLGVPAPVDEQQQTQHPSRTRSSSTGSNVAEGKPRKLQKRRKPSEESTRSSFEAYEFWEVKKVSPSIPDRFSPLWTTNTFRCRRIAA
ncbi:hypothetical protein H2203_000983 [Taxawa tesnikishii (nom. ined.)]|nr:hypothetical protein H2203_000983 [Dothideales sp. JES 119]